MLLRFRILVIGIFTGCRTSRFFTCLACISVLLLLFIREPVASANERPAGSNSADVQSGEADGFSDSFFTLDKTRWQAVNLIGSRQLPGVTVTAADGILRIAGTTSSEGINLSGVRTQGAFSASSERPFVLEVTRAYHGGRQATGELGVMLWRSMSEFVYVRESLDSLFKDWNHYQAWQVVSSGDRRPSARMQFIDISDENAFLAAHPQPLFNCQIQRVPRSLRLVHNGSRVTIFLDGEERQTLDIPWSDHFVVCLMAGAWRSGTPVDVGFSNLRVNRQADQIVQATSIDAQWQTAAPDYWTGDDQLQPGAVARVLSQRDNTQLAMVVRSNWPRKTIKQFIDWSSEQGINCIALDIPWRDIEREPGKFDFSRYDGIVNYVVNKGMFVQLKPWWIRRNYPDWISPELEQLAVEPGKHLVLQELTFAHDGLNDRIARFVAAAVEHYRRYPVTCYTPVGATAAELEYSHADYRDGSRWATTQFQSWLNRQYGSIESLNASWGASYADWASLRPPTKLKVAGDEPDTRQSLLDWFAYREWSIKQLVDRIAAAVKAADPQAVLAIQMGRILDGPLCPKRATVGAFYWASAADMLIVDPQPKDGDLMGLIIDVIRTDDKLAGMELDAPSRFVLPMDRYTSNSVECWQHGGMWASWANWAPSELEQSDILEMTKQTTSSISHLPTIPRPDRAMYVSKWDLYCYHDRDRWREYRDAYAGLTGGGKGIIDVLTDDIVLADPNRLSRYSRIDVPFADCIDRGLHELLQAQGERLSLQHPEAFGRYTLEIARQ